MSRSDVMPIRFAPGERQAIEAAATAVDRSIAQYVRLVVLSAVSGTNRLAPYEAIEAGIRAKIAGEAESVSCR